MLRNISILVLVFYFLVICPPIGFAQSAPNREKNRTTGVVITGATSPDADQSDAKKRAKKERVARNATDKDRRAQEKAESASIEAERIAKEKADQERAEADRLAAEKLDKATADAARLAKLNAELEAERRRKENELRDAQKNAVEEKARLLAQSEADKQKLIEQAECEENQRKAELAAKEQQIILARIESERMAKENTELQAKNKDAKRLADEAEQKRITAENALNDANRLAKEVADKAAVSEAARLEAERLTAEKTAAEKPLTEAARLKMIAMTAERMRFLNAADAVKYVSPDADTLPDIEASLSKAVAANRRLVREIAFCDDPDFVAAPLNLELSADDNFGEFLSDLRGQFGVNFLPDAEILELPVRVNVENVPWNIVLCQQAGILDIDIRMVGANTLSLIRRSKLLTLQDSRRKTAPTRTEFIKLKYLRPKSGVQSNLAGKSTGTASLESLEQTVQKILQAGGDNRGSISQVPGRSEFFITATEEQLAQIREVIEKADRPTYRVDVYGLVYTINENRLKDVGSQLSAVVNTGGRISGLTTLPSQQQGGTTGGTNQNGSFIGSPFSQPGGLQAGAPNTILAARASLGLVDFNYQLSLLEQLGIARRVEKPFLSVKDGSTGTFENGTQIPVVIQALNNLGGGGGGSIEFINAGTTLNVSPQVIETADGIPSLVNLTLRLESNTPDLSITTSGNVPSVNSRRLQSEITLAPGTAFISGGSNDTGDSNTVSRTPVLGELPIIGNFFRRKTKSRTDNKLYFAVWVQISLDDGSSPIPTDTLNTTFPTPPAMEAPLRLPKKP
ncbi:MAG: hypothetical protein LH472_04780 [Pyrinomonadaceae bacterium]|nr:hypothetical protein [Pyrinomonadaceae bacterium]